MYETTPDSSSDTAEGSVVFPAALLIGYPLLMHLGVVFKQPGIECVALQCLYAAFFYRPLRSGQLWAWLGFAVFAAISSSLVLSGHGLRVLYLPSIAMPGLVLLGFARSLLPKELPLITRIAQAMHHGPLSPEQRAYTRNVTWLWVGTTALLLLVTLSLIAWGSLQEWSVFSNFVSYGVLAMVFVAEYVYRRRRFPSQTHVGFPAFLRAVIRHGPR